MLLVFDGIKMGASISLDGVALGTAADQFLRYTFDVICVVAAGPDGPQLRTSWRWSDRLSSEAEVDRLGELWSQAVAVLGDAL